MTVLLLILFGLVFLFVAGCSEQDVFRRPVQEPFVKPHQSNEGETVSTEQPEAKVTHYTQPANQGYTSTPGEPMYVYFIDVGYGDATLIKKGDFDMLIDTGSSEEQGEIVVRFLKQHNVDDIDLLVLTLPFQDHMGGVKPIFKNFDVEEIWDNGVTKDTGVYRSYEYYRKKYAPDAVVKHPVFGDEFDYNGIHIDVINPGIKKEGSGFLTHDSLTMVISDRNFKLLMTDLQPYLLKDKLRLYYNDNVPKLSVLKVSYHGGNFLSPLTENCEYRDVINMTHPDYAVILVGPNQDDRPNLSVLGAFEAYDIPILRTDMNGTITIVVTDVGYNVTTER